VRKPNPPVKHKEHTFTSHSGGSNKPQVSERTSRGPSRSFDQPGNKPQVTGQTNRGSYPREGKSFDKPNGGRSGGSEVNRSNDKGTGNGNGKGGRKR
jgi:hypothetical protein